MKLAWIQAFVVVVALPSPVAAQTLGTTTPIATLEGPYGTSQMSVGLYGTDLGYSVSYKGELRVVFGDSVQDGYGTPIAMPSDWPIGFEADDSQGIISLAAFPNGDVVDSWVTRAGNVRTPAWRSVGPTLSMRLNGSNVGPIQVWDGNTTALNMGVGKTPIAAFSNNKPLGTGGVFAFFARQVAKLCTNAPNSCGTGTSFYCDHFMGTCSGDSSESAIPCTLVPLTSRCNCLVPFGYTGVCQDRTSSVFAYTEDGRILSTVLRNRIGNADQSHNWEEVYYTKEFATNKFNNISSRTVLDFDPSRPASSTDNKYAAGNGSGANEKVFLWGRPNYIGYGGAPGHLSAKLYFAYANMPTYSGTGAFTFSVYYFSGFGSKGCVTGGPSGSGSYACFSPDPVNAWPLELQGNGSTTSCSQLGANDKCSEQYDIVNQQTVSWVPALGKFVMIYGGDDPPSVLQFLGGPNYTSLALNPNGSLFIRWSAFPWGPWSPPVALLGAGPRNPTQPNTQYAANGALYDPYCDPNAGACVVADPGAAFTIEDEAVGRLYGANIVDEWTMTRTSPAPGADIYWFSSSWDPYEVFILRTRINL